MTNRSNATIGLQQSVLLRVASVPLPSDNAAFIVLDSGVRNVHTGVRVANDSSRLFQDNDAPALSGDVYV